MNLKDDTRKRALLLHYVGETVHDIYEAGKANSPATYDETKKVLSTYFKPKRNTQMEIFNFRSCKQKSNQSLDDFVTELRKLKLANLVTRRLKFCLKLFNTAVHYDYGNEPYASLTSH